MRLDDMHICNAYEQAIETHLIKLRLDSLGYSSDEINQILNEAGLEGLKKFAKGALKKTLPAVALGAAALSPTKASAQDMERFGWREGTGQPTKTVVGGLIGAGAGAGLARTISKGKDAPLIGAGAGLVAGGLLGNYFGGPKGQPKQQPAQQKAEPEKKGYGTGSGDQQGSRGDAEGKPTGPSKMQTDYDGLTQVPNPSDDDGSLEIAGTKQGKEIIQVGTMDRNWIKSPYSDFSLSKSSPGIKSGDIMLDPIAGKKFKVPAFN